ncbi:DUF1934 domain-containing protein [Caloramator sp. E03]|uniref:DUF1934 domain-containing protein n=1 Tax=Caloramator sp. E03 TaxID=2576307 RepID=UPI0011109F45|nr:DUF1934 domain-containing protein [Caloramator sp. E03]QCX33407.1 DUF1934 domain-containing protein [Caloramator sp. E03]
MEYKALISVKTKQAIDGEYETIELITEGKFFKEDNRYMAEYEESEISGMEGTKTTLKIEDNSLTIIRRGTTNSNLVFKKGVSDRSIYSTPFGSLEVLIKPTKVDIDINEKGGKVELEYRMEAAGFEPIDNSLELNIKPLQ